MVKNKRIVEEGGDIWKSTGMDLKISNQNFVSAVDHIGLKA